MPAAILLYTAALLTALEYVFFPPHVEAWLQGLPMDRQLPPSLKAGLIWSGACVLGYALIPASVILLLPQGRRPRFRDLGFQVKGFLRRAPVYLGLLVAILPFVYLASRRPEFRLLYPFVLEAKSGGSAFWVWEVAYIAQFFALEAFFRGFLLFNLEQRMGTLSIFVMTVPYTMIHYHKPMIEAFGALGAGLILGFLALKTRSWLGGALLHSVVALTMDGLAVLSRSGGVHLFGND
jgi:membrane protease YdiL (CAAX protease family)